MLARFVPNATPVTSPFPFLTSPPPLRSSQMKRPTSSSPNTRQRSTPTRRSPRHQRRATAPGAPFTDRSPRRCTRGSGTAKRPTGRARRAWTSTVSSISRGRWTRASVCAAHTDSLAGTSRCEWGLPACGPSLAGSPGPPDIGKSRQQTPVRQVRLARFFPMHHGISAIRPRNDSSRLRPHASASFLTARRGVTCT
jgi:hypothetical protein